jgi:hypothetical protein
VIFAMKRRSYTQPLAFFLFSSPRMSQVKMTYDIRDMVMHPSLIFSVLFFFLVALSVRW